MLIMNKVLGKLFQTSPFERQCFSQQCNSNYCHSNHEYCDTGILIPNRNSWNQNSLHYCHNLYQQIVNSYSTLIYHKTLKGHKKLYSRNHNKYNIKSTLRPETTEQQSIFLSTKSLSGQWGTQKSIKQIRKAFSGRPFPTLSHHNQPMDTTIRLI